MKTENNKKMARRTFWTLFAFYFIIAFEFFYMASPFAIYFYSVYRPGLNLLDQFSKLSWVTSFFLPHIVEETSSIFINTLNTAGMALAVLGFLDFIIGAVQVYYYKLMRKGAVTGGIYKIIRHPQYLSLAVCSFGLLLLWPRYLVLIMFITIIFAYYFLAKAEEKECKKKYGQSYIDYKNNTYMFVPIKLPSIRKINNVYRSRLNRYLAIISLYVFSLAVSILLAGFLKSISVNSLYTSYNDNSVYLSIFNMEPNKMQQVIDFVDNNKQVKNQLNMICINKNAFYVNYILPAEMYISEIPMNKPDGATNHIFSKKYPENLYKIIFTEAMLRQNESLDLKDVLRNTVSTKPILEVWFNSDKNNVIAIKNPPETNRYENIPIPVF